MFITMLCRYRDRYWRESTFRGVELVRKTLEDVYGADKVSLVSAALRWLNHHSAMKQECNGEIIGVNLSETHLNKKGIRESYNWGEPKRAHINGTAVLDPYIYIIYIYIYGTSVTPIEIHRAEPTFNSRAINPPQTNEATPSGESSHED